MFDVITIGGATRDIYFKIKEAQILPDPSRSLGSKLIAFPYGAKIVPNETYFGYGGGAANTAIALAKLGLRVATCLNLGKEGTGDIVLENLKSLGVDIRFITRDPKLHTAISFIISGQDGDRVIFRHPGSDANLTIKDWSKVSQTKWFYITSLRGRSEKILNQVTKVIAQKKIKLCFNPGETQLAKGFKYLKKILAVGEVLILNREEASILASQIKNDKTHLSINSLLDTLRDVGPKIVVITCGKDGAYALGEDGDIKYAPPFLAKVVDPTGAGDAFGSGFLAGLIFRGDLDFALHLGAANAASVISAPGAQNGFLTKTIARQKYKLDL